MKKAPRLFEQAERQPQHQEVTPMTAATVSVPTASQIASAARHLADRAAWTFYRVSGVRYVAMQSATSGKTYTVRADGRGCSCRFYEVHQALCAHALAVIEAANQDNLSAYLADAADELLAEYEATQAYQGYQAVMTLARMGGFCPERGCQNDAVRGEDFCRSHLLVDVA